MSKSSSLGASALRRASHSPKALDSPVLHTYGGNLSPPESPKASDVPLRAWPPHYGREVPEILGLDEYTYKVGARCAHRAKTRFVQDCREEAARPARRLPSGAKRPKSASGDSVPVPGAKERILQAGVSRSSVILWNRSGKNTDKGAWQLNKRRQKLTDDMLREIVVFFGDPLELVTWWFRIFQFYCDKPVDVTLPELPASADDELLGSPSTLGSTAQLAQSGRSASQPHLRLGLPEALGGSRPPSSRPPSSRPPSSRPPSRMGARHPEAARGRPQPPKLRELARRPSPPEMRVSEEAWEQRQREIKSQLAKQKVGCCGKKGPLALTTRCAEEIMEPEDLAAWVRRYEGVMAMKNEPPRRTTRSRSVDQLSRRNSGQQAGPVKKCFINFDNLSNALDKLHATNNSSASSEDGSHSRAASASDHEHEAPEEATAEGAMLRSVSYALLSCGLLQKARAPGQEKAQLTRAEVLKERSRIVRSVAPVEMSLNNLGRALSCFGMARRSAVEHVARYLNQGVSRAVGAEAQPRQVQEDLPFAVFYRLMRALHGNARPSSRMPQQRAAGALAALGASQPLRGKALGDARPSAEWPESELLRRLVFAVLVGWEGPEATASMPEKQSAYGTQVALSVAGLQNSLRMLLCTPVLLEVDAAVRAADDSQGAAGPTTGASGSELRTLAEFLHAELAHSEADGSFNERPGFVTFHGFERFVNRFPGVFSGLVLLLMPLTSHAADYMAEESEIGSKKGSLHRAGELRATINAQTQLLQRSHFDNLLRSFALPWLAARAVPGGDSATGSSGCGERASGVMPRRA